MPETNLPAPNCRAVPHVVDLLPGDRRIWCGCGRSESRPWCDSRGATCDKRSVEFAVQSARTVWLCSCLRTDNPPYCDGSHSLHEDVS